MKSIFLVNPISGRGHLDSYARLYSRAFVELGYRVVLVAESDADAPGYLARNVPELKSSFSFHSFSQTMAWGFEETEAAVAQFDTCSDTATEVAAPETPVNTAAPEQESETRGHLNAALRARSVWQAEGLSGVLWRLVVVPRRIIRKFFPGFAPDGFVRRAYEKKIKTARLVWRNDGPAGILRGFLFLLQRAIRKLIPETVGSGVAAFLRRAYLSLAHYRFARTLRNLLYPEAGRIRFQTLLHHLQSAPLNSKEPPPDLVLFLYLDMMAEGPTNLEALNSAQTPPWIGIQFHPRMIASRRAKIERYFQSRTARGGIFLIPTAIDKYAKIVPDLKFALAPDVADLELADEMPALAREIRKRATGRKIILQVGTIAPHKGIMTLIDVISRADSKRLFFAFVGEVHWENFGLDEKRLRQFYAQPPENVYIHEGYLKEERDYNSLITACDVIYAVYRGFNSSSNSLTKAAGLRRPILVTKNTLMGERVLASGIGMAASEGNSAEILEALDILAGKPPESFGFNYYMQEYSLEKLKSVLAEALPRWMRAPSC